MRFAGKATAAPEWREERSSLPVPPLLHQSWGSCSVPFKQRAWQRECDKVLPRNWSMWLWTDEDNRELIARDFPSFLPLYDGYDVKIKRIDAVRYFYLYKYGGVYMDLDVMCLHPLEPVLRPGHATFGTALRFFPHKNQTTEECEAGLCFLKDTEQVHPAFMAAPPRHPFLAFLIHRLHLTANVSFHHKRGHPLAATGPVFLGNAIRDWAQQGHGGVHVRQTPTFFQGFPDPKSIHRVGCGSWAAHDPTSTSDLATLGKCAQKLPNSVTTSFWAGAWLKQWLEERSDKGIGLG